MLLGQKALKLVLGKRFGLLEIDILEDGGA